MKEERLGITPVELNEYLAKARLLRSQELARLSGRIFRLPRRLLMRLTNKFTPDSKSISSVG